MNSLVFKKNGSAMASTVDVAAGFDKPHKTVIRNINSIIKSDPVFGGNNFVLTSYTTSQNKVHDCYEMTRDGFALLAMGFTGSKAMQWKIKYLTAFNAMEAELTKGVSVMDKFNQAVALMEKDAAIASSCGKGLSNWRKVKTDHVESVERLKNEVQLTLGFGGAK